MKKKKNLEKKTKAKVSKSRSSMTVEQIKIRENAIKVLEGIENMKGDNKEASAQTKIAWDIIKSLAKYEVFNILKEYFSE